ncbi:MAG: hypothetical protein U0T84_02200 [Chitinophagales bacterium]
MLPADFIASMQRQYGALAADLLAAIEKPAITSFRINPFKSLTVPIFENVTPVPWCGSAYWLAQRPSFTFDPRFHAGAYYVQEASSMFLETIWKNFIPDEPLRVLDACAAPGGKSTHLLSLLNGKGLLVSNEMVPGRNSILRQNIARWGMSNVVVTQNEIQAFESLPEAFDVVVVDAPCSGEGLFRKDHEARGEWTIRHVAACAIRQEKIVASLREMVAPGGFLIYSTCTFEDAENDAIVSSLTPEFECLQLADVPESVTCTKYGYAFLPHLVPSEGFYISCWKKKGERTSPTAGAPVKMQSLPAAANLCEKRVLGFEQAGRWHIFPETQMRFLRQLQEHLYVRAAGIVAGEMKGNDFIPDQELALAAHVNTHHEAVAVDYNGAIAFLQGQPLPPSGRTGWKKVCFEGNALGWIKEVNGRTNNYYPKGWRIQQSQIR